MIRILITILLTAIYSIGQDTRCGLILPDFNVVSEDEVCCVYVPKDGFTVYDSPNGQEIGTLLKLSDVEQDNQAPYKLYFYDSERKVQQILELSNFKEIGYEVWALTYFDRADGFLRIIDDDHNYWLDEKEIFQKGFEIETWQNFLLENSGELLGFYANEPGLYLRESPDTNAGIIAILTGDLFEIYPTTENFGSWTKVTVKKYREHPCRSNYNNPEIIESELNGWIKIVDDNGRPNVWYYPRGC